jgi:hypothetical protein
MRPAPLPALLGLTAALLVTMGIVSAGTVLTGEEEPAAEEVFETTPLEDLDTSTVVVQRAGFCDDMDPRQVEAALGAPSEREKSWSNGDRITLPSGDRDVVHEFGCEYVAADGSVASGWVFAHQVEAGRGRRLVENASAAEGCQVVDGPAYGDPSVQVHCVGKDEYSESHSGLFGDAWLTCRLALPGPAPDGPLDLDALEDRTGRWCVGVALAAS